MKKYYFSCLSVLVFLGFPIITFGQSNLIKVPLKLIEQNRTDISWNIAELSFEAQEVTAKTPSNISVKIERSPGTLNSFSVTPDKNNDGVFSKNESFELNTESRKSFTQRLAADRSLPFDIFILRNAKEKVDYINIQSGYSLQGEFSFGGCRTSIFIFDHNANTLFDDQDTASNIGIDQNNDGKIRGAGEWGWPTEIFEICGKNYLISGIAKGGRAVTFRRTNLQNVRLFGKSPKFNFTLVSSRQLTSEKLNGQPFLLDFWASWCGPCLAKIPEVKQIEEKLPVIYFNTDTIARKKEVLKLIDNLRIFDNSVLRISPQADTFYKSYQRLYRGLPYYVLIDGESRIRYAGNGGEDLKELKAELKKLGID